MSETLLRQRLYDVANWHDGQTQYGGAGHEDHARTCTLLREAEQCIARLERELAEARRDLRALHNIESWARCSACRAPRRLGCVCLECGHDSSVG